MTRIFSFILVRLFALGWILALANILSGMNAYAISLFILASEALFGYVWGKAEAEIRVCRPKHENPRTLFVLMVWVALIESIIAFFIVHAFAPWLIVWRTITSYLPFALTEMAVYAHACGGKGKSRGRGKKRRVIA
ncbi:hypothetical protein KJZ71_00050 [Patescibacteria group bacterium]|uniref:Uncharacterized protein n=1 Tax=candidate division WWE3 bacterium TaxID=2053526 RepID=A0A928TRM9_UNCKA|nr:hypothetical protein [candidate division WWE3 bacterium]MCL4732180.1 hypothetical protein [Patescibacteria group bacterium]MDL1953485.1 hypothetical protein [Candidatus Uhrbacteria bacterium UHB]RIL00465.1 MAG: hypothetical protein DCC77_02765 [Candidatus Uhrbacteria bacterium]